MTNKCFVPHCNSGYKTCKQKVTLFSVPSNSKLFEKWKNAVNRKDKEISRKHHICEKHFAEEDIIRYWVYNDIKDKLTVPRLKKDAVPCIFPPEPNNPPKVKTKRPVIKQKRKQLKKNPLCKSEVLPPSNTFFDQLWNNELLVTVPTSSWALHRIQMSEFRTIIISDVMISDSVPFYHKQIVINEDSSMNIIVGTSVVSQEEQIKYFGSIVEFGNLNNLNILISTLHLLDFTLIDNTYITEICP